MNSDTKQALSKLKQLNAKVCESLYAMIGHAKTCLADTDWIAAEHEGDTFKAQDWLQSEFFPVVGGFVSLGKLIALFDRHPESTWREYRYNLQAMIDVDAIEEIEEEGGQHRERISWKARCEELEKELAIERAKVKRLEELLLQPSAV